MRNDVELGRKAANSWFPLGKLTSEDVMTSASSKPYVDALNQLGRIVGLVHTKRELASTSTAS